MASCHEKHLRCGFDPGNTHCDRHGPPVSKGKIKPKACKSSGSWDKGLTVLPTKAQRWAQLMREIDKQHEEKVLRRFQKIAPYGYDTETKDPDLSGLDAWTRRLAKALNVDLEARS